MPPEAIPFAALATWITTAIIWKLCERRKKAEEVMRS